MGFDQKVKAIRATERLADRPGSSRRLPVPVSHVPTVHGVQLGVEPCCCWAECTCGARVERAAQVATFTYNHSEPGPELRRLAL